MSFLDKLFRPPDIEKMKSKGDVKGLVKALNYRKAERFSKQWDYRQRAAQSLGELADARAVEPLIAALDDRAIWVRLNAAKALVSLYNSGKLEAEHMRRILENQASLNQHVDMHTDYSNPYSDCSRDVHTDLSVSPPV